MTDAEHWKAIALYLADCHAATAQSDGMLRSTSKSRAARFASICEKASEMLRGVSVAPRLTSRTDADVIDRLDRAVAALRPAPKQSVCGHCRGVDGHAAGCQRAVDEFQADAEGSKA